MVLLAACEKQVDIDVDAQQPKVVVYATGEADSTMYLRLTYSRPVFSTFYVSDTENYFKEIDNATVTLSVNGGNYVATNSGGNYTVNYAPQPGDYLKLMVKVPGKDDVTAEATVPSQPSATDLVMETASSSERPNVLWGSKLRFKLIDDGSTTDYYSLSMLRVDTIYYTEVDNDGNVTDHDTVSFQQSVYFKCIDYTVITNTDIESSLEMEEGAANTFYGDNFIFSDANINGMRHEFTFEQIESYGCYSEDYGDHYGDDNHHWVALGTSTYYLVVTALSRDMYLYQQSLDSYTDGELFGLFGEPVQIHSNVEGGIGIFGINTKSVYQFYRWVDEE